MKIALVLTGGTILSEEKSDFYTLSDSAKKEILSLIPHGVEAEVFSPYFILSEQLDGDYLTELIDLVGDKLNENYDGIVILHGTDTIQFSAAALSLAYGRADTPVVLVSANYVLSDERSNGRDNLLYALRFIDEKIGGVFVSYRNTGENPAVFPGNTLLPHLPYSDTLYALNGAYGCFEDDKFNVRFDKPDVESVGRYSLNKNSPVLWLRTAPGSAFPDTKNFKAVLIDAYHSGTLPTESESFVKFCESCNKPVYVAGISEGKWYASARHFDSMKLKILPEISPVFAYISLWRKYSG